MSRRASSSCAFAAPPRCTTAVRAQAADADIVVMAAAVADYTPSARADGKIEKSDAPLELALVRTPDILAELGEARGARIAAGA